MNDLYGEQVMEHYRNPSLRGRLPHPDATFEDQNPLCGDTIRIDIAYSPASDPAERRIAEIRFSGEGCAISQAAASMLTEMVAGQTVAQAQAISKEDLLDEVGISLSPMRVKCALLSLKVLKAALYGLDARPLHS